ncbi:UDP-N-acetylmuramate--L-alanine ligase [Neolewinella xylanilytica]|uniref:UDP-N-acetylmuramate--L-alanine ligase n=1 Tax=Neolewinella xylanilytica TaxID=1514080 RepID=A0A2S6I4D9_9BACT|nr:UDP-N-acetylmuramate--L-alanine ligase [Neolewinella xylanilytica]PPK86023.1 UDP-N-acetylmuramate--L-alanine ligase [Neolewinella xylanilytica]
MQLSDIGRVYFIGIGGIGMSAVARYFRSRGVWVGGYDRTVTPLTQKLESEGMEIHYEARVEALPEPGDDLLVVYTPAIPKDFPELVRVQGGGYTVLKRSEVLGLISRGMRCVGIAGTHGKTTTTTITTYLMVTAGLDPSAFLGGIARDFDGNYVHGDSDWVVVEADEYDRSFLRLNPEIAVVLSTDPDHLDIYGDHGKMLETGFRAYAKRVKPGGQLIVRYDVAEHFADVEEVMISTFGIGAGDFCAQNIRVESGAFHFDLREPDGHLITNLRTALPGRHNVENAVAACAVTRLAGGHEDDLREGLANFHGIARRFETVLKNGQLVVIDDYAHHPTELQAAISAARELYPNRPIRGVFQPHLYSRTQDFAAGFARALDLLDEAIIIPIYPAREEPIPGVTSQLVYGLMKNEKRRLLSKNQMLEATAELKDGVLLLLGAGDIDALVPRVVAQHSKSDNHGY